VTEQDVFRQDLLRSIGGVLSQSIVEIEEGGHFPTVELGLGPDGEYPGHIIVNGSSLSGLYRIRYEELVPMALFVDSGGTSLFTLWGADKLPDDFAKDAGFVEATDGRGHVAIEFAGTRYENALVFLDNAAHAPQTRKTGSRRSLYSVWTRERIRRRYGHRTTSIRMSAGLSGLWGVMLGA